MKRELTVSVINSDLNAVDRFLEVEKLRKTLLPLLEPLVDDISKINIDINADNQLLINEVSISNDFRQCSDFTISVVPGYLFFNDNGIGKFVDMGIIPFDEANKVYEIFRISRRDKRIKIIEYRVPERDGTPIISPFARPDEYEDVAKIIESEGAVE